MRRASDLWNEGEKALAHIHLTYADLPIYGEDEMLRLFLAEECFSASIPPADLEGKAPGKTTADRKASRSQVSIPGSPDTAESGRAMGRGRKGPHSRIFISADLTSFPTGFHFRRVMIAFTRLSSSQWQRACAKFDGCPRALWPFSRNRG
jgi:hypothetical protein